MRVQLHFCAHMPINGTLAGTNVEFTLDRYLTHLHCSDYYAITSL